MCVALCACVCMHVYMYTHACTISTTVNPYLRLLNNSRTHHGRKVQNGINARSSSQCMVPIFHHPSIQSIIAADISTPASVENARLSERVADQEFSTLI